MWKRNKAITVKGASIEELWEAHSDIKNWAKWQTKIKWTKIDSTPNKGVQFQLKPKSGPKVKLEILNYQRPFIFTDVSHLPLAKMYTTTNMNETQDGVEIELEIEMKGPLTFLWKKVIAMDILNGHETQNQDMIKYIQENR